MNTNIPTNNEYWGTVPPEEIIGTQAIPGDELFKILPTNAVILDLGCGNGEIAELLAGHGYMVTGIDINQKAIFQNQSKSTEVKYLLGDITQPLPFPDDSFDSIISSFTLLNMMPSPIRENVVAELSRVLKPQALIWINDALVSESYAKRYVLSRPYVQSDNDFCVFKQGTDALLIQTPKQMSQAIQDNKVARITHHFTVEELDELFKGYEKIFNKEDEIFSPNSKSVMKMGIMVYRLE